MRTEHLLNKNQNKKPTPKNSTQNPEHKLNVLKESIRFFGTPSTPIQHYNRDREMIYSLKLLSPLLLLLLLLYYYYYYYFLIISSR